MLKPVGIKITSTQCSASEELYETFFGSDRAQTEEDDALLAALERPVTERLDERWLREEPDETEEDVMEVFAEGSLLVSDGDVRLTYRERDAEGNAEVRTVLSFAPQNPAYVTMSRTGAVNTAFIFEVGKHTKCVYDLTFGAMELTVFTVSVDNRLVEDGALTLDYCIEIRGADVERRRVKIELSDRAPVRVPRERS